VWTAWTKPTMSDDTASNSGNLLGLGVSLIRKDRFLVFQFMIAAAADAHIRGFSLFRVAEAVNSG